MEDKVELQTAYYPVVYKSSDKQDGTTATDSLNAIASDYANKLGTALVTPSTTNDVTIYEVTKEYDPNVDFSTLGVAGENITWAWAIENNDSTANGADTILANLQVGTLKDAEVVKVATDTIKAPVEHTDYNLNTSFLINIKVEQVD